VFQKFRFIQGLLNVGESDNYNSIEINAKDNCAEKESVLKSTQNAVLSSNKQIDVPLVILFLHKSYLSLIQRHYLKAEESYDTLSFLQALPGSKNKARSTCNKCGNSYRDVSLVFLFSLHYYLM